MDARVCLIAVTFFAAYVNCQFCVNKKAVTDQVAKFPPFPARDAYQATFEVNQFTDEDDKSKGVSWYAEESFDPNLKRGKIHYYKDGKKKTILTDLEMEEMLVYDDSNQVNQDSNTCESFSMLLKDQDKIKNDYWNDLLINVEDANPDFSNDDTVVTGVMAIWGILQKNFMAENLMYAGKENINGLDCDVWQRKCSSKDDMLMTIYFSPWDFNTRTSVPVRIELITNRKIGTFTAYIDRIYNFVKFELSSKLPAETLQPPPGMGCRHLAKNLATLPEMKNFLGTEYRINFEMLTSTYEDGQHASSSRPVHGAKVAFDSKYQLYVVESTELSKDGDASNPASYKVVRRVYDYGESVLYTLEPIGCKFEELGGEKFRPIGFDADGFWIELALTFRSSGEYQYLSEGIVRGRPVQIFEAVYDKYVFYGKPGAHRVIVTKYCLSDRLVLPGMETQGIFKIEITIFESEKPYVPLQYITINVNEFRANANSEQTVMTTAEKIHEFNIASCFLDARQSRWFSMYFPLLNAEAQDVDLMPMKGQVVELFATRLYQLMPPTRINDIIVDIGGEGVTITAKLLDRIDYLSDFDKVPGKRLTESSTTRQGSVFGESECAKLCASDDFCNSFSACGPLNCAMTQDDIVLTDLADEEGCDYYKKMREGGRGTIYLLDDIALSVNREGNFKLQVNTDSGIVLLSPSSVNKHFTFDPRKKKSSELDSDGFSGLYNYDLSFPMTRFAETATSDDYTTRAGYSFDQCRNECDNEQLCHSFQYSADKLCVTTKFHRDEIEKTVKTAKSTKYSIFTKPYVFEYESVEGYVLKREADARLEVESADMCAKECTTRTDLDCKSFDYCDDIGVCLIHTEHRFDSNIKFEKNDTICAHYTKLNIYSFQAVPNKKLKVYAALLDGSTLEDCAKLCLDTERCDTFDYCNGIVEFGGAFSPRCQLAVGTIDDKDFLPDKTCSVYNLRKQTLPRNEAKKSSTRYSSGLGTGFGLMFFFIGSAAGVLAIFGYRWFYKGQQ